MRNIIAQTNLLRNHIERLGASFEGNNYWKIRATQLNPLALLPMDNIFPLTCILKKFAQNFHISEDIWLIKFNY